MYTYVEYPHIAKKVAKWQANHVCDNLNLHIKIGVINSVIDLSLHI